MTYDFDAVIERRGTNSMKYDFAREMGKPDGILPMWVADMDFAAPPEVLADLQKIAAHGIFGYTEPRDAYYEAVADWFGARFGYHATRREIVTSPGVVFALAQAVRAYTNPGDAVLVQTPVYYPFYDIIQDNGRTLVRNPLLYKSGRYSIDFFDFERKIAENAVKLFILCSPHNPVGRVWTRAELERIDGICEKRGVIVVSDEIHCDFAWDGHTHTCYGLINEDAIIATAPSKTFNLAGLHISNVIVKNSDLRKMLVDEIDRTGFSLMNVFGLAACQSAYAKGGQWLAELKAYLFENIRLAREYLAARIPKVKLVEPEGTYLLWLDFKQFEFAQVELDRLMAEKARLWLNSGTVFGADGEGFSRINIACPKSTLEDALGRLEKTFDI